MGTGKKEYEFGDITKTTLSKITGKTEYEFGDISRAVSATISEGLGRIGNIVEAVAENDQYQFGDLTKAMMSQATGNPEYEFGDVTKSVVAKLAGVVEDATDEFHGIRGPASGDL